MVKKIICKFAVEMCSDKFSFKHALHGVVDKLQDSERNSIWDFSQTEGIRPQTFSFRNTRRAKNGPCRIK